MDVVIDAASINSRESQRDAHLRSADFLDVEHHPQLTFKSTRVERTGENTARLYGDLTIRGMTRPVVLDVTFNGMLTNPWGMTSAGFSASTRINRKDWRLEWNVALEAGGWLVGDEVEIAIEAELIKVSAEQPA